MLPIASALPYAGTPPRRLHAIALTWCCVAGLLVATLSPAWAQTAASTEKAQERSQHQTDNVYRWIRYFADQPKKVDPNAVRPKTDAPQLVKKPEVKAPAGPTPTPPATETAATPSPAQPGLDTPRQQAPVPQTVAAAAPAAAPEPEVTAEVAQPLKPVFVVEPTIPREMRDETINTMVRLGFTVQQDGTVATPTVISGDNRRLNRSAMNAIAQWRFEPIQTDRLAQIEFEFRQE